MFPIQKDILAYDRYFHCLNFNILFNTYDFIALIINYINMLRMPFPDYLYGTEAL